MHTKYVKHRCLVDYETFYAAMRELSIVFDAHEKCAELKPFAVKTLHFSSTNGASDVVLDITTYPGEYKSIELRYKWGSGASYNKNSIEITRLQAMRLIMGDFAVTDQMPGLSPAEINVAFRTMGYTPSLLFGYDRVAFTGKSRDVRITYDTGVGVSRDFRSVFDKTTYTPVHYDTGVLSVEYKGFIYGIEREVTDELLKCGIPQEEVIC